MPVHHLQGTSQECGGIFSTCLERAAPTTLKKLNTIQDKETRWIGTPSTTFNIHSLHHRCTVAAVCTIYKIHCSNSPRLLRQHLPNPRPLPPKRTRAADAWKHCHLKVPLQVPLRVKSLSTVRAGKQRATGKFQALCSKQSLLQEFGNRLVRLSTANTYSYQKVDVPFKEYVEHMMKPQSLDSLGSDTFYFFGDNNYTEWDSLFRTYIQPPYQLPGTTGAYSFGIAGAGTGVPFHWHGAGYSEVIYGRKRWFLYPPEKTPEFHPNRTTLSWMFDMYPYLSEMDKPMECTIHPGEVLYFPDRWWHATLNIDTSVFISTFLG
ncbi:jmjC domain-containing protein 8 isoform X2 [Heterodontus francisci]|uniref:jmjC domain-containing protein 8 isoform X2 n=1 Tax=Heterodontus francisci TaxID=7792 RepID=UPI00355C9D26